MQYALFLGCTIPARTRSYEASARRVCSALQMNLVDILEFACCGFPLKAMDVEKALLLSARNLALAQQRDLDILTLCSSCTSALAEAARELNQNPDRLEWVNRHLARVGLHYSGGVRVQHVVHVLHREIGLDAIVRNINVDLSSLHIASHHGCHFLKPSDLYGFDRVEAPSSLDELVALTEARVLDYRGKTRCCGGPVMAYDPDTAVRVARRKLITIASCQVDAMTLACPFCSVMYESNQKGAETESGEPLSIPILFITQILGLGMGFSPRELGLKQHIVKPKRLLEKLGF